MLSFSSLQLKMRVLVATGQNAEMHRVVIVLGIVPKHFCRGNDNVFDAVIAAFEEGKRPEEICSAESSVEAVRRFMRR